MFQARLVRGMVRAEPDRVKEAGSAFAGKEARMKYRGVEYVVVQTISKQWRWLVTRDCGDDKVASAQTARLH